MRHYEAMYLVEAETTDEALVPIMEKYQKVITDMGGTVGETGKWENGRRRLTYEIDGRREGMFVLMNFEGNPDVPLELDRIFRINDDVFRHIIVRQDEDEE